MFASRSSLQEKTRRLIQTTLSSCSTANESDVPRLVFGSNKERVFETKWKRWMNTCHEYVERVGDCGAFPSIGNVQRYMLYEFGLSDRTTSRILHDLAEIGRIQVIKNRVAPCK